MKLTKIASGKRQLKLSKREWTAIGKTAGWMEDEERDALEDPSYIVEGSLVDDTKFSNSLENEIEERLGGFGEAPEDRSTKALIVREMMEDMDDSNMMAYEFRTELQNFGIQTGVFKPKTKADLSRIIMPGGWRGKFSFQRKGLFYVFDSWVPLGFPKPTPKKIPQSTPKSISIKGDENETD